MPLELLIAAQIIFGLVRWIERWSYQSPLVGGTSWRAFQVKSGLIWNDTLKGERRLERINLSERKHEASEGVIGAGWW